MKKATNLQRRHELHVTNLPHHKIGDCQARRKDSQPTLVLKDGQLEVAPLQSYFRVGD